MKYLTTTEKQAWPTLAGRLRHPLTALEEAVSQLQTTMPITPAAQAVLKQSDGGSSNGRKKTAN